MKRTICIAGLAGLMALSACKGGNDGEIAGNEPLVLEKATGDGIVVGVSGVAKPETTVPADQGAVIFDIQHVDRLVNNQVSVELVPAGGGPAVAKGPGNEQINVAPGTYDAHLIYRHSKATRYEGDLRGLEVFTGRSSKYKVKIEAPVGFLDLKFLNDGVPINDKDTVTLYPIEGEGDDKVRGDPVLTDEPCTEPLAVPAGRYDALAVYHETEKLSREGWVEDLLVPGAMEKFTKDYDFAVTLHGFILHAKNFGEPVDDRTTVYFYQPGAPVEFAVALDQGPAGKRLIVKPGRYDVRAVFQSTPEQSTWGDKVLPDVAIAVEDEEGAGAAEKPAADAGGAKTAAGGAADEQGAGADAPGPSQSQLIEMDVDFEKPLATLKLKVAYGGEDVSEKAQLRVLHAGADKVAAAAVLNVTGLGEHLIPAGDYDIEISYNQRDLQGSRWFERVELEHGQVWEQTFDFR